MGSNAASEVANGHSAPPVDFEGYVAARQSVLIRTACLVVRDWEEAQDAVQDALVSLWPRWATLPADRLDAYVHRSVVNACLIRLRRLRRVRPTAEVTQLRQSLPKDDPTDDWLVADQAWRLCGELPPVQRAAVVLRYYRDLSYTEIGAALGCPSATARSHVHRAVASLRKRYEGENNA